MPREKREKIDWDTFGGGTCVPDDVRSYSKRIPGVGTYYVTPVMRGRRVVYLAQVTNNLGMLPDALGLWNGLDAEGKIIGVHVHNGVTDKRVAFRACERHLTAVRKGVAA